MPSSLKKNRQTTVSMVSDTAAHPLKAVLLLVGEIQALRVCERLKVRLFCFRVVFFVFVLCLLKWLNFSQIVKAEEIFFPAQERFLNDVMSSLPQTKLSFEVFMKKS